MLPDRSRTVPVVNIPDDLEDEPGAEMAKEARVWRTYVRETDRWDKEMMDGRNTSLDVLLIFAALFSAISTAFIIVGLDDLKPDPAELSAQTLLVMSQMLAAIANGQPVSFPAQDESNATMFSPSRSAVVVNTLWLLSLILSLAVSLITMLAKEWCYKFMSGRSGPIYDQARRRQEKWNGIERWKMRSLLAALPGAMHIALPGLCVYLWDINISVAVPVVVLTVLTACVYMLATIMPWVDKFCPYNTPATNYKGLLLNLRKYARFLAYRALSQQTMEGRPLWLKSALECTMDWLEPKSTGHDSDRSTTENTEVPMDDVTTQMLAWLIENCEDQRSVDAALQAFSGAYDGLPTAPLGDMPCRLAASRLVACVKPDPKSKPLSAEELSQLSIALRYSRACITLLPGCSRGRELNYWNPNYEINIGDRWMLGQVCSTHMGLLELAHRQMSDSGMLATVATSAAMPICHWTVEAFQPQLDVLDEALDSVTSILAQHFEQGSTTLPASTIYRLAESSVHYLVSRWPSEEHHGSHALLPILLARVVATYYKNALDTARAAAITLAVAAFAFDAYPGGEEPAPDDNTREKRAVSVLRHYQTHKPDQDDVVALFLFGFFGVLPRCIMNGHDTQLAAIVPFLNELASRFRLDSIHGRIWSTPQSFSLEGHINTCLFNCFSSAHVINGELARVLADLWIGGAGGRVPHHSGDKVASHRTYANTLIALCLAKSEMHREFFTGVINAQWIPDESLEELKSYDDDDLLRQLCHALVSTTRTPMLPVAVVHFGLLVASVILFTKGPLDDRRSALRPLLSFRDSFPDQLREPSPFAFEELVSHLEQCITEGSTTNSLGRTMQFVVDFCGTDWSPNLGSGAGPTGGTDEVDWRGKLQELKDRYRPDIDYRDLVIGETESSPPVEGAAASGAAEIGRGLDRGIREWSF